MKNIDEKILMAEEEIKQLQNKRKKLISQQKQEDFESIFTDSKDFTKDEFYQLITFSNIKEAINQKILKIIEKRKSKYRKSRGRNGNRGIVPCLQGRTYTP